MWEISASVGFIRKRFIHHNINVSCHSDGLPEFCGYLNSDLSILPHFVTVTVAIDKLSMCYMCGTNINIYCRTVSRIKCSVINKLRKIDLDSHNNLTISRQDHCISSHPVDRRCHQVYHPNTACLFSISSALLLW